ncbi:MAG: DUF4345 domain-containing protein [Silicimonas sp.]|jgi:hypothetical protein|nr:DUF4345 domain-containing protein [Silicimonas sp.]
MTLTQKFALCIAGTTSLGIGAFILTAPHAFYASYGIALGTDPSLLSELRAPGAGLAAFGAVMLAGSFRPALGHAAFVAAQTVFLAFPAGRVLGILADGIPSHGILGALVLELAIAALCLFAFRQGAEPAATGLSAR